MRDSKTPNAGPDARSGPSQLQRLAADTLRTLAIDTVQKANSGHPGLPMGMADAAMVLWTRVLKYDPSDPDWPDRDRFVLSAGHGSALLYGLLHLSGYDLPLGELQAFRRWGSRTPGHPERGLTPGVEITTGPLGQGLASAVGLAMAERWLAERFNRPGFTIVDHHTYVIASDGDMMEGVSHEACALAGHLGLGKLVVLYDDNGISIDGPTSLAMTEDVLGRFGAYGWHTSRADGHDAAAVEAAVVAAREERDRPSLVACQTHIGFGSPNRQDKSKAHGEPLGVDEVRLTKQRLGWPPDAEFRVPEEVAAFMREAGASGTQRHADWKGELVRYQAEHPELARAFREALSGELPEGWDRDVPAPSLEKPLATRAASGAMLNAIAPRVPTLIGGSADLTRARHGQHPQRPRAPRRRSALRRHVPRLRGLHAAGDPAGGDDGATRHLRVHTRPTHQPVEHLAGLRAIPNLVVFRPADATETIEGWRVALERRHGPTALILTRQALPVLDRSSYPAADGARRGAYVLAESPDFQVILIATGSEVQLALEARKLLETKGIPSRVVSMPSWELFAQAPAEYRESVLPSRVRARVAVEAGATLGWERHVGLDGAIVGLDRFGASAPYKEVFARLGFTAEAVAEAVRGLPSS